MTRTDYWLSPYLQTDVDNRSVTIHIGITATGLWLLEEYWERSYDEPLWLEVAQERDGSWHSVWSPEWLYLEEGERLAKAILAAPPSQIMNVINPQRMEQVL